MVQQEVTPVGGGAVAGRTGARTVLHVHRVLRVDQPDLRDGPFSRALPDRISLYRPGLDRPAVRRRFRGHPGRTAARAAGFMKARVAIVRVTPATILSDIDRLMDVAGVSDALVPGRTTILKDNISWHFPFPAANTTPWQLEGTIQALARRGYTDQVCVQNKTVVT